eukprot:scaffold39792_cov32-Tisochrysis_lutea.AAC.2
MCTSAAYEAAPGKGRFATVGRMQWDGHASQASNVEPARLVDARVSARRADLRIQCGPSPRKGPSCPLARAAPTPGGRQPACRWSAPDKRAALTR